MLIVENHGPLIIRSNFWDLPETTEKYLVSVNAGAFRLLLPRSMEGFLEDMQVARGCAITRGPWPNSPRGRIADAAEILFDDATDNPFALHCESQTFDHMPLPSDVAGEWVLTVWTAPRRGKPRQALSRPCRYRLASHIPWLKPWSEP